MSRTMPMYIAGAYNALFESNAKSHKNERALIITEEKKTRQFLNLFSKINDKII